MILWLNLHFPLPGARAAEQCNADRSGGRDPARAASAWEREGLRVGFGVDQDACELVQFRPAVVAPRGEARADIDIVFDLAVRLGLGNQFWQGDIDAALDHHLAPSGISGGIAPQPARHPLATRNRL